MQHVLTAFYRVVPAVVGKKVRSHHLQLCHGTTCLLHGGSDFIGTRKIPHGPSHGVASV